MTRSYAWRIPCEACGSKAPCAHYPETPGPFWQRVQLAAQCIANDTGIGSRGFDGCFEQYDGAFVIAALDRLAQTDARLRAGIDRLWRGGIAREKFAARAASLAHLRTDQLERAAADHRRRERNTGGGQIGQAELAL